MITKEQALAAHYRQEFHTHGSSGKVYKIRANGKCQTWKTRPLEFRLPCKYGLSQGYDLTDKTAHEWHLGGDCDGKHA